MAPHPLQPHQLIEFSSFDTAFAVAPDEEEAARRRYMTLLVDSQYAPRKGASSTVYRVSNTECSPFALKVLKADDLEGEERERLLPVRVRKFAEEYRAQTVVSHLSGFPKLYGYGVIEDVPAILMEWVEGFTLNEATPQFPADIYGRIKGRTIAGIGMSVLNVLISAKALDERFVHRDLSPRNIMLRTSQVPLEEQAASNVFDICLVDLGSATIVTGDTSLTLVENIWRNGTPDYAPPEMLARDVPALAALRSSTSIDTYALCSILYELYAQTTPYGRGMLLAASPYRVKVDNDPMPLVPRSPRDEELCAAIMAGLAREQDQRITAEDLLSRLSAWAGAPASDDAEHRAPAANAPAASGDPLEAGSHLTMNGAGIEASLGQQDTAPVDEQLTSDGADTSDAPAANTRGISRRSFVIGALSGIGLTALSGAAVVTRGFGLLKPKSLDTYTWAELSDISKQIAQAETPSDAIEVTRSFGLLDQDGRLISSQRKSVEYDGMPHEVQIVGINHDELADGSGYAGLTFMFCEILSTRPMSDAAYDDGGWEASDMRAYLNTGVMDKLPAELRERIVPVRKYTNNVGGTEDPSCVTATEESLWLFSYCELAGERARLSFNEGYRFLADILNSEGSQYDYFEQQNVMPQSNADCLIRQLEDEADYWWLRSASPDVSLADGIVTFNRVGPNGDPFHFATACTDTAGILPGFCI